MKLSGCGLSPIYYEDDEDDVSSLFSLLLYYGQDILVITLRDFIYPFFSSLSII